MKMGASRCYDNGLACCCSQSINRMVSGVAKAATSVAMRYDAIRFDRKCLSAETRARRNALELDLRYPPFYCIRLRAGHDNMIAQKRVIFVFFCFALPCLALLFFS